MQASAKLRYLMMSPRKIRRVVTLVKGKTVEEALKILKFTPKAAALPLAKTIESATANALSVEGTSRLKAEDLSIYSINVDEGPLAKRIRFRAMGRVYRYKKRFAHITVVVKGMPQEEPRTTKGKKQKAAGKETSAGKAKRKTTTDKAAKKVAKKKTAARKTAAKKTTAKKTTAKKRPAKKKSAAKVKKDK